MSQHKANIKLNRYLFQAYVYERVGISLVKVYEMVGFVTDSFLKDSAFTAV